MALKEKETHRLIDLVEKYGHMNVVRALEDKRDKVWTIKYHPELDSWQVSTVRTKDGMSYTINHSCNCKYGVNGYPCVHKVLVEMEKWDQEEER